jgi:hypothetical protein
VLLSLDRKNLVDSTPHPLSKGRDAPPCLFSFGDDQTAKMHSRISNLEFTLLPLGISLSRLKEWRLALESMAAALNHGERINRSQTAAMEEDRLTLI